MPLQTVNRLLDVGLGVFLSLGFLLAVYEGRCWAFRQPGLSYWAILRPDTLFKPSLYTERGNELRLTAVRLLVAFGVLGILLLIGIVYRNGLEHAA